MQPYRSNTLPTPNDNVHVQEDFMVLFSCFVCVCLYVVSSCLSALSLVHPPLIFCLCIFHLPISPSCLRLPVSLMIVLNYTVRVFGDRLKQQVRVVLSGAPLSLIRFVCSPFMLAVAAWVSQVAISRPPLGLWMRGWASTPTGRRSGSWRGPLVKKRILFRRK